MRKLASSIFTVLLCGAALSVLADQRSRETNPPESGLAASRGERLQNSASRQIHFSSAEAQQAIVDFHIDCRTGDGRYVPLMNVLIARLSEMQRDDAWLETFVEKRGGDIRVYDQVRRKDGAQFEAVLAMELNQWGELRPIGVRRDAIYNTCGDGPYGRLWVSGGN